MNNPELTPMPEEALEEINADAMSSVDEFIKELEAKEKDLHITSDLTIEIEDSDFGPAEVPEFVLDEITPRAPVASAPMGKKAAAGATMPGAKTRIYELQQEVEKLNERIAGLRAERNEIQEKSDRRLKDFEAYKYRMDRERRGSFIEQIANLAGQILPVLDNLDRALDASAKLEKPRSEEFQQFYDGIALVNQQVHEVLADMGVEPIKTVGENFDPNFHEAVAIEDGDEHPPNTVTGEMLRGYRIGNRVIRHSMVKVTAAPQPVRMAEPAINDRQDELPDLDPDDNGVELVEEIPSEETSPAAE